MKTLTGDDAANDGHVFTFTIARGFGSDSWSGMRLVEAAVPGFEDVSGVGDKPTRPNAPTLGVTIGPRMVKLGA